jgi:hypothetical protein
MHCWITRTICFTLTMLQRSYLLIQPFFGPHAVWFVSYQSLSRSWHTWSWLRFVLFIEFGNRTHSGCDRSTGDAYSSMAPDPTSGVFRSPCKPEFCCGLFHYLNWTQILTAEFSVYLTSCTDFDSWLFRFPNLDTLILNTDFNVWYVAHGGCDRSTGDAYSSMAPNPTSVIFRGLCTPILWFVFPIRLMRLITVRYFFHFIKFTEK